MEYLRHLRIPRRLGKGQQGPAGDDCRHGSPAGSLSDKDTLHKALLLRDHLSREIEKIYAYARLQLDADNGDTAFQSLAGKAESLLAAYGHAVSFIDSEILAMAPEARKALQQDPAFSDYDFYLKDLDRQAEHILSSEEESLLAQSQLATGTGSEAFRALASADLSFPDATDSEGQAQPVSEGVYMLNMSSPDRTLREHTFRSLFGTYGKFGNTLAATLTGACRRSAFYAKVRHYDSSLAASLADENIPTSLYSELIETIHRNLNPLHEYIRLKKKFSATTSFITTTCTRPYRNTAPKVSPATMTRRAAAFWKPWPRWDRSIRLSCAKA